MRKLDLPKNEIIDLYNSGLGAYKIAKKFSCSGSSINNYLRDYWGVDTKKTNNNYRKYTLDDDFFSVIDTEEKAYFLGLLYADGCVSDKNVFTIRLQERDSYILQKFLDSLKTNLNLSIFLPPYKSYQTQKGFSISSKKMCKDLIRLGCVPRKSLILKFPKENQVPEYLIHHFIRGSFDGDGTAFLTERIINKRTYIEPGLAFISSIAFIEELKIKLDDFGSYSLVNKGKNGYLSIKNHKELPSIIDFLYKDATIYLDRKKELCEKILIHLSNRRFRYTNEKIYQYDLDGRFVKVWNNIAEIKVNSQYNTDTILRNISGKLKTANNYLWKLNYENIQV